MLVLSRKQQEFVQIGDDIRVRVIRTSRGSVKIGIEAPEDLRVLRGELGPLCDSIAQPAQRVHPSPLHEMREREPLQRAGAI